MSKVEGRRIEHAPGGPLTLYPVDPSENLTHQTLDIPGFGKYRVDNQSEHGHAYFATRLTQYGQEAPERIVLKPFLTQGPETEATETQLYNAMVREHDVMAGLHRVGLAVPRPLGFFEKHEGFMGKHKGSYLMTEYFGEHDLIDAVELGLLTSENTMLYFQGLLEYVAYLHDNNLIYRDVKPSNIRITADGRIGFTDWGTVHRLGTNGRNGDDIRDYPIGLISPGYSPLEQGARIFVPHVEADLFALGMTLYFMREGHDPLEDWIGTEHYDNYTSALEGVELVDNYPPRLREFMYKMTKYNVGERYHSAHEALAELQAIIDQGQY